MNVPSVVWFGHDFKKEDGKKFRAELKNENYESEELYIRNEKQMKNFIELRMERTNQFQFLTFVITNLHWKEEEEKEQKSGGFFKVLAAEKEKGTQKF